METDFIIEIKVSRGTSWEYQASTDSVLEEQVETTAGTIRRHPVVFSLNQQPHEDVAHATNIKLKIVNVVRVQTRTMIVREVTDVQEVYHLYVWCLLFIKALNIRRTDVMLNKEELHQRVVVRVNGFFL